MISLSTVGSIDLAFLGTLQSTCSQRLLLQLYTSCLTFTTGCVLDAANVAREPKERNTLKSSKESMLSSSGSGSRCLSKLVFAQ